MAEDEVVHSIGSGLTDKLTSFFSDQPVAEPKRGKASPMPSNDGDKQQSQPTTLPPERVSESHDGDETQESEIEPVVNESIEKSDNEENHDPNEKSTEEKDQMTEVFEAKEEDQPHSDPVEIGGHEEGTVEAGFGKKKSKSGKKPQTGLLKEILNAKPSASGGRR